MGIRVIKGKDINVEELKLSLYFETELNKETLTQLKQLVNSWYLLASNGGFGGTMHSMSKIWYEGNQVGFIADIGSMDIKGIDILIRSIEGLFENIGLVVHKIVIGEEIQ